MKKLGILALVFLMVGALSFAKVTINEAGGKYTVTITNSSYANLAQLNIIGSFMNWQVPGEKMTKNASGEWEITIPLDVPMIKYKFYDPAKSGDGAYLDDPEFVEKIANPFGTFDYLVKRPKGGKAAEDDFSPVFGMWARIYYNINVMSDMTFKAVYDKDGKIVYNGFATHEWKEDGTIPESYFNAEAYDSWTGTYLANNPAKTNLMTDKQIGFSWAPWQFYGENGTTPGSYTRLIFGRDSLSTSTTLKFHGMVAKNFKVDVEVNAQLFYSNSWSHYWQGTDGSVMGIVGATGGNYSTLTQTQRDQVKDIRELQSKQIFRDAASNFVSALFGGHGRDYVMAKQYYNKDTINSNGTTVSGGTNYGHGSMHVDQVAFTWTTKDFDISIAPAGGKSVQSGDYMGLIGGDRTGSTNYVQSNAQALIHPTAVKGLNANIGTTYSGVTGSNSGAGAAFKNTSNIGRYLAYGDISYDIMGWKKYKIGAIYTMSSYVPDSSTYELDFFRVYKGLDAFANAIHQMSVYANIAPIDGLNFDLQGAMELPTRYFDNISYTEENVNWMTDKASKTGYDFLAHSAYYFKGGYSNNMFGIDVWSAGTGTRFEGDLAKNGSMFANFRDVWTDDLTETNYGGHGDALGKIKAGLNFNIKPLNSDLIKITYDHQFNIGARDVIYGDYSFAFATQSYKDQFAALAANTPDPYKSIYMVNLFTPGVVSMFKVGSMDMEVGANATISLTSVVGETTFTDSPTTVKQVATNTVNLDKVNVRVKLSGISDILKSIDVDYQMRMYRFDAPTLGYYGAASGVSEQTFNEQNNLANWNRIINQVIVEAKFKNDIFVGAGYVFRIYHGLTPAGQDASAATKVYGPTKSMVYNYYTVADYWNWGIALQFKYVIPVKALNTPTFFANLGIGWDPFHELDPGYAKTDSFQHDRREWGQADDWSQAKTAFQFSDLTLGLKWDF